VSEAWTVALKLVQRTTILGGFGWLIVKLLFVVGRLSEREGLGLFRGFLGLPQFDLLRRDSLAPLIPLPGLSNHCGLLLGYPLSLRLGLLSSSFPSLLALCLLLDLVGCGISLGLLSRERFLRCPLTNRRASPGRPQCLPRGRSLLVRQRSVGGTGLESLDASIIIIVVVVVVVVVVVPKRRF